jgi:outer membrane protein assembly factor BamB
MRLPNIIFTIFNVLLVISPSLAYASVLEKGRCYLMTPDSGPCLLEINDTKYEINANGIITCNPHKEGAKSIQVLLPEHFFVEAARAYDFNNDIIFSLQITDGDGGSTIVAMFNLPSFTLSWAVELGAFNPSPPLVEASSVYIGGIGTIAKIDAKTGRIIWKHTGLYERDTNAFNSFLKPFRRGAMIIFKEQKVSTSKYQGIREIWVNDKSGEIVRK